MKKTNKFLIVFVLIIAISAMLVACTEKGEDGLIKLDTPTNIVIQGDSLTWGEVKNAVKYSISIEDQEGEISVESTTYSIKITQPGSYKVSIKAVGDGKKYGVSEWSEAVVYTKAQTLNTPVVTLNQETGVASWAAVVNAKEYRVQVLNRAKKIPEKFTPFTTTELSYNFLSAENAEIYKNPDAYSIIVEAIPSAEEPKYKTSPESAPVKFIKKGQLPVPTFNSISETTLWWNRLSKDINGDSISDQTSLSYKIKVKYTDADGQIKEDEYTSTNDHMSIENIKLPVTGKYELAIKAIGDEVYSSSEYSEPIDKFSFIKLPAIKAEDVTFTVNGLEGLLKWHVDSIENVGKFQVLATSKKADGSNGRSTDFDIVISSEDKTANKLDYEYNLATLFYTLSKDDTTGDTVYTPNANLDNEYFGKEYEITITVIGPDGSTAETEKIRDSEILKLDKTYENYFKPEVKKEGGYDWYVIDDACKFSYINQEPDAKYLITNDLNFRNYAIKTIPNFTGVIFGQNHTIKNLVIKNEKDSQNIALFETIGANAVIKDLLFRDIKLDYNNAAENVAILANNVLEKAEISNLYIIGDVKAHLFNKDIKDEDKVVAKNVGGVVTVNNGSLDNVVANVNVKGNVVGGLVAINNGTINYSYALGKVEAVDSRKVTEEQKVIAGGLVGINNSLITGSFADNLTTAKSVKNNSLVRAGGLIGINEASAIVVNSYAGPMYSRNATTIKEVESSGNNSVTGGFVGENKGDISNAYSTLRVVAGNKAGGFVGINSGKITNAYAVGGIAQLGKIGGFACVNTTEGVLTNVFFTKPFNGYKVQENEKLYFIEDNELTTLSSRLGADFAKFEDKPAPVLKYSIYLDEYVLKTRANTDDDSAAKYIDKDGKVIEILSIPSTDPKAGMFEYLCEENDIIKGNVVRAQYKITDANNVTRKIQVLVEFK